MEFNKIDRPVLILDEFRCKRNINRMVQKADTFGCEFRPHFKTHQSAIVGEWFREIGVTGITVSSTAMALYFADHGWDDITIAFPFFPSQLSVLKELQEKCRLRLFLNSVEDIDLLSKTLTKPLQIVIELDTGHSRSGIHFEDEQLINSIISAARKTSNIKFHGFYVHEGGTYKAKGNKDIQKIITPTLSIYRDFKKKYPEALFSLGDTPSTSVLNEFPGVDEITPGNFVFYDWMQVQIGSCTLDDVALFAVLPVAQNKYAQNRVILHGGAVHLSKEFLDVNGQRNFGQLIEWHTETPVVLPAFISSVSQEHGILTGNSLEMIDNSVLICPIHSCLTANLHNHYITTDGKRIEKRVLS